MSGPGLRVVAPSIAAEAGRDRLVVIGFGGQYMHLIARRLREQGFYTEIIPYNDAERIKTSLEDSSTKAVILSGGPPSVHSPGAPRVPDWLLETGKPVLGICYGFQLLTLMLGGTVETGCGEYGRTRVEILDSGDPLFRGWERREQVWMSHGDCVKEPPPGARLLAVSENGYVAAFRSEGPGGAPIYGVQFHPEVKHTPKGRILLRNYAGNVAGAEAWWDPGDLVSRLIKWLRENLREGRVLAAVSGGVDSTVTAVLLRRAIGDRLTAILVDHGLFREGEVEETLSILREAGVDPVLVRAGDEFLNALRGVRDPEEKRRIIGRLFIEKFVEVAERYPDARYLAQGTLYPDVIESGAAPGADRIKSHHNVGGLPERLHLTIVEPLREFYKDEVRRLALALGLPRRIAFRHPFPGPGLAVRIIGEVTPEKLAVARKASKIVEEEVTAAGLYEKVWQAFAVVGDDRWVGVKGDRRVYGYIVTVRIVESEDGMTADWVRLPYQLLDRIASRITREIPEVTMVTYAVTTKPPSTIEPQ